ncbi:hypothetical protein ACFLY7_00935 [Patescibacteria group bacterium]
MEKKMMTKIKVFLWDWGFMIDIKVIWWTLWRSWRINYVNRILWCLWVIFFFSYIDWKSKEVFDGYWWYDASGHFLVGILGEVSILNALITYPDIKRLAHYKKNVNILAKSTLILTVFYAFGWEIIEYFIDLLQLSDVKAQQSWLDTVIDIVLPIISSYITYLLYKKYLLLNQLSKKLNI